MISDTVARCMVGKIKKPLICISGEIKVFFELGAALSAREQRPRAPLDIYWSLSR